MTQPKPKPIKLSTGEDALAVETEFETVREEWNVYRLPNGDQVRVKVIVARIMRVVGEDGQPLYGADGEPEMYISAKLEVVATEHRA